jgi:hypothetical protein
MASESDSPQPICPYVTGTVTRYCTLTPLTLTDEEREAIALVIRDYGDLGNDDEACEQIAAALRGLLERTDRT